MSKLNFSLTSIILVILSILFLVVSGVEAQSSSYPAPQTSTVENQNGYPPPEIQPTFRVVVSDPPIQESSDVFSLVKNSDQHCPSGWLYKAPEGEGTKPKGLIINISGKSVSFNMRVSFCVKAGTRNSGIKTGENYTVDFDNEGGQFPDISYVVIYEVLKPTETPFIPPTLTPTNTMESTPTETPEGTLTNTPVVTENKIPTETKISTLPPPPQEKTQQVLPETGGVKGINPIFLFSLGVGLSLVGLFFAVNKEK